MYAAGKELVSISAEIFLKKSVGYINKYGYRRRKLAKKHRK
jgi:hypothetical protein